MNRILETVIANTITIGIIVIVCCISSLEVKHEYNIKNRAITRAYYLKFF